MNWLTQRDENSSYEPFLCDNNQNIEKHQNKNKANVYKTIISGDEKRYRYLIHDLMYIIDFDVIMFMLCTKLEKQRRKHSS